MGAEAQITTKEMGIMSKTSAITARRLVIAPLSVKANTWESLFVTIPP